MKMAVSLCVQVNDIMFLCFLNLTSDDSSLFFFSFIYLGNNGALNSTNQLYIPLETFSPQHQSLNVTRPVQHQAADR